MIHSRGISSRNNLSPLHRQKNDEKKGRQSDKDGREVEEGRGRK